MAPRGREFERLKGGSKIILMGSMAAIAAACQPEANPSPTQASEIIPTRPIVSEFTPIPTQGVLVEAGIAQERTEILAGFGGAVGTGGSLNSPVEKVFNNSLIQGSLNRASLAPVIDSENGLTQVVTNGDQRVCFPNMPEKLFNPSVASEEDNQIETNEFIISYGDVPTQEVRFKGLGAVALETTRQDLVCVNAIVNSNNNPFGVRDGVVLNVLIDQNSGDIYGTLPSIYGPNQSVRFDFVTNQVVVDNEVINYEGPRMVELSPAFAPNFESSPTLETTMRFNLDRNSELADVFPEANVYRTARGDVVVVDNRNNLHLAGQTIETRYGNYTFLVSSDYYQTRVDGRLSQESLSRDFLSEYPDVFLADQDFFNTVSSNLDNLRGLRGYKAGGDNLVGYPNLVGNPNNDELMRMVGTLIDLTDNKISMGSVNLASYQPQSKDFVAIFTETGNAYNIASSLLEGVLDPETDFVRWTSKDLGSRVVETPEGDYVFAFLLGSDFDALYEYPYPQFYNSYGGGMISLPIIGLVRDAARSQGIDASRAIGVPFYEGPFSSLIQNYDSLGNLVTPWGEQMPSAQELIDRNSKIGFHIDSFAEVDIQKFR